MLNNQSFQFFQKSRKRDDLPLVSRTLIINQVIKKKKTIIYKIPGHPVKWKSVMKETFEIDEK